MQTKERKTVSTINNAPASPASRSLKSISLERKITNILLYTFLFIVLIIQIFPLYYLITFSLKTNIEIFGGNIIGLPENWRWDNYQTALTNGNVLKYFFNSVFVCSVTLIGVLLLGTMAAYGIERLRWKLNKVTLTVFLLGIMIPLHAALLPLFVMLRDMKLLNSYGALIIPYIAFGLPIAIYIFTGFMASIPKEMEESACIEGASIYQAFFKIIIPMILPALATVAIFTFLTFWNELMFANIFINKDALKPISVGVLSLASRYTTQWGPIGAALLISTIPTLVVYTVLSKQVQNSFRAGAVKG